MYIQYSGFEEWWRVKNATEPNEEDKKAIEREYREKNKTSKMKVAVAKEDGYAKMYQDPKENGLRTSIGLQGLGKEVRRT